MWFNFILLYTNKHHVRTIVRGSLAVNMTIMYVFYGVLYERFLPEREDIYSIQILLISYQNTHCHSHEGSNIK